MERNISGSGRSSGHSSPLQVALAGLVSLMAGSLESVFRRFPAPAQFVQRLFYAASDQFF